MELLTTSLLLRLTELRLPPPTTKVTFSDGPLITLDIIEADVVVDELVEAGMAIMPVLAIIVGLISNEHAN